VKTWRLLLVGLLGFVGPLAADGNEDWWGLPDQSTLDEKPDPQDAINGPFLFKLGGDAVGRAKFDKGSYKGNHFTYDEVDLDGTVVVHYNETHKEGITVNGGYAYRYFDWKQNPYFDQKGFNSVYFGLGFFTHRAGNWDWKGFARVNLDPCHLNLNEYMWFDMLLWGRYKFACDWGFHAGIIALTGMKIDRVYPIIGLDWSYSDRIKINAIFPLDFSIVFKYNCDWSFYLGSRTWDVRQRTGKDENVERALWEYRAAGAEIAADYRWKMFVANVHLGYSLGGRVKISNEHHRHTKRLDFKSAPYAGGELSVNF
jgi:hypothetical protein